MTGTLQLTEQRSPAAQTFIVAEDSVLTGIGVFFFSSDPTYPITLELRPTSDGGNPSAKRFIQGTRVTASAAAVGAKTTSSTFGAAREYKFTFPEPQFVPANSLVSFVLYTSAPVGTYKIFTAKNGEFNLGTTTSRYTSPTSTADGAFFGSSNGTSWEGDNTKDIAFKVYRAKFTTGTSIAKMSPNIPPVKKLTETDIRNNPAMYSYDPLVMTAGADSIGVIHPAHGFMVGDKVEISATSFDSSDTINGVSGADILGTRTILKTDPFGYTVAIGSAATATLRAGGTGVYATEQYTINNYIADIQYKTPGGTGVWFSGDFTTATSFGGSETAYNTTSGIAVNLHTDTLLKNPHVIASKANENLRLSGDPSATINVNMITENEYVAPYVDAFTGNMVVKSNLIDYQQSDDSSLSNRNKITTFDYVAETEARGGTNASKHITIPYYLQNTSTSLLCLVDAIRPINSDFTVWYRTCLRDNANIEDVDWIAFDKESKETIVSGSSYSEIAPDDIRKRQYEFSQFNIDAFDTYQIKITMNSTRSSYIPVFDNLRIVATSD